MTSELHRPIALDRIGPQGTAFAVDAEPDELSAVASRLRVVAVSMLHCAFKLRRIGGSTIEAQGVLKARVTEVCVVSLEPFDHDVHESFAVHFVPAGTEDDEPEPDAIDQIPFETGSVDVGEAAVEQLALALDPYPRRPGAELPAGLGSETATAFAALAVLRPHE